MKNNQEWFNAASRRGQLFQFVWAKDATSGNLGFIGSYSIAYSRLLKDIKNQKRSEVVYTWIHIAI